MPEYFCECCNFKTLIKCKFINHNETTKHLKKLETFVKVEVSVNPLQEKVDMLEQTIKLLIKRIEILENNQGIKPVAEPVVEPVVETKIKPVAKPVAEPVAEPLDIDILMGHIEEQYDINLDEYTIIKNNRECIDWDSYINKNLDDKTQQKIANGEVVWDILKDTYQTDSEKAIFKKICNLIPRDTIKVSDLSRGKFSIFCVDKWLSPVESTEKIDTIINILQQYVSNLHNIHTSCKDMYVNDPDFEKYIKLNEKVFQGTEIKGKILKLILSYYK
jgi:hypothetical protein